MKRTITSILVAGVILVGWSGTARALSACATAIKTEPAFIASEPQSGYMMMKLGEIKSDAYLQDMFYCDPTNATEFKPLCTGPDLGNGGSPTDNVQLVIAKGVDEQAALGANYEKYECYLEVLKELKVNIFRKEGTVPVPTEVKPYQGPQITGLDCNSSIFDCSKPLSFLELPVYQVCEVTTLHLNKQEQVLIIDGRGTTLLIDPRTQKAVACRETAPPPQCEQQSFIMPVGKNADGSTHLMVIDGVIALDPAPIFQKAMTTGGKPLLTILSTSAKDLPLCDDVPVLNVTKAEFDASSFQLPNSDGVTYDGDPNTVVKKMSGAFWGNRVVMLVKNVMMKQMVDVNGLPMLDNNNQPVMYDSGGKAIGVQIFTLGDTAASTKWVFKPLPADVIAGNYKDAIDAAITLSDATHAEFVMALKQDPKDPTKFTDLFDCNVPFDDATAISCDKKITGTALNSPQVFKAMVTAKLKQQAYQDLGDSSFGSLLGDVMNADPNSDPKDFLGLVMHGFDGVENKPAALDLDPAGTHLYRLGGDGKAFLDPNEVLLGENSGCFVADLDNYGGKDLICFADQMMYFIPKLNLAPQIGEKVTITSIADKFELSATVKTQEDEDLSYTWGIYRMKGNLLVKIEGALNKPTDVKPLFSLSSLGAKDETDLAEGGYFALLTVVDPGGLSDSVMGSIPMKSLVVKPEMPVKLEAPVKPEVPLVPVEIPTTHVEIPTANPTTIPVVDVKAATTPLPASADGSMGPNVRIEGGFGCSALPGTPSSNFIWILVIPAFMSRILRAAYRRK